MAPRGSGDGSVRVWGRRCGVFSDFELRPVFGLGGVSLRCLPDHAGDRFYAPERGENGPPTRMIPTIVVTARRVSHTAVDVISE